MDPSGRLRWRATTSQVTFGAGSSITISVYTYNGQCVPTIYDMEVDGDVTLTTNGTTFAATYGAYTIHDDASSGHDMVEVSGAVTSACFGDTVLFSTSTDIALGNPCPSAGVVDVYATTSFNMGYNHLQHQWRTHRLRRRWQCGLREAVSIRPCSPARAVELM